ncbi:MAG: LptF/LptG family permease, partial [Candidatus Omnitrophica bacterium]|nr:LptF/LptG family permease [Candidatus Omnitrophota bacterium]
IIVLRSGGLGFWQITKSAICFGLVVSVLIFWINERFVPQATTTSENIRDEAIVLKSDAQRKKEPIKNLTFYGLNNRLFFIDTYDPNDSTLKGITIIGHDENQKTKEKIVALTGKWTGLAWKFYKCQIAEFAIPGDEKTETIRYEDEKLMSIKETPKDFLRQRLNVSSMNIRQLSQYIKRFSKSGAKKALNNLHVDLHQKIAYPFGNFIIDRKSTRTFASLGIAIAVGFLFYVSNAVGLALGKGGVLSPLLSAWLAPMLFLVLAFYLIKTKF